MIGDRPNLFSFIWFKLTKTLFSALLIVGLFTWGVVSIVAEDPDLTPPSISAVTIAETTTTTATITWNTDEPTTSRISYGTSGPTGSFGPTDATFQTSHSVTLIGLQSGTLYYFCLIARDTSHNQTDHCEDTNFTTQNEIPTDDIPPLISNIVVSDVTTTSATISWTTDEIATSVVEYGRTSSYGSTMSFSELTQNHSITITRLSENTQYHYRVVSLDGSLNRSYSDDATFTTASSSPVDITAPNISGISTLLTTTSATIFWSTDEGATSQIEYGLTDSYGSTTILDSDLLTSHEQTITGLSPNTHYHFRIISIDGSSNQGTSTDQIFSTSSSDDGGDQAASISNIYSTVGTTYATIYWTTDESSTSKVEYGTTSSYGLESTIDNSLVTSHEQLLDGLNPNTVYHFRVISIDSGANTTYSIDQTFETRGGSVGSNQVSQVSESETSHTLDEIIARDDLNRGLSFSKNVLKNVQAIGLDRTIFFSWKPDSSYSNIRVVRSQGEYPESPTDGVVVYDGSQNIFSDLDLENGNTYYYSLFPYNEDFSYADPVKVSIAPYAEKRHFHVLHVGEQDLNSPKFSITKDLGFGDRGDEVEHLQEILSTDPNIYPRGLVTGFFGPLTKTALIKFQKKYNLEETGNLDEETRKVLENLPNNQYLVEQEEHSHISDINRNLSLGDFGSAVVALQTCLIEKGYLKIENPTGYFGAQTFDAVILFQKENGIIPATGFVGQKTRTKIIEGAIVLPK